MDPMSHLLDGVRARRAVLHRSVLEPPWALRIEEGAQLTLAAVLQGHCTTTFDDGHVAFLGPGQLAIIAGPDPYVVADAPDSPIDVVVRRDGVYTPDGTRLPAAQDPVTCTLDADGSTVLISGSYVVQSDLSARLMTALPRLARVDLPQTSTLLALVVEELGSSSPVGRRPWIAGWTSRLSPPSGHGSTEPTPARGGMRRSLIRSSGRPCAPSMRSRPGPGASTSWRAAAPRRAPLSSPVSRVSWGSRR